MVLALAVIGALAVLVYELLEGRAAIEPEQPIVDLSSTGEAQSPGDLRLAAPERAPEASATEPVSPRLQKRAPASPHPPEPRKTAPARSQPPEPRKLEPVVGTPPESKKAQPAVRTPEAPLAVPDFIVIEIDPDKPRFGPSRRG